MAKLVSRRPVIGIAAGLIFGALGMLVLDQVGRSGGRQAVYLFNIAGYFFLFVAVMAVIAAILAVLKTSR